MDSFLRRTFSYDKLPAAPIRLSILKLDGSSFDIQVKSSATVGDLKVAIEAAFDHVPKDGPAKISWSHVWGHFCLSFKGRKLVADSDLIGSFGVKDADQIQFIRHVSNDAAATNGFSKRFKQPKLLLDPKDEEEEEEIDEIYTIEEMDQEGFEDLERGSLESCYWEEETIEGQRCIRIPGITRHGLLLNGSFVALGLGNLRDRVHVDQTVSAFGKGAKKNEPSEKNGDEEVSPPWPKMLDRKEQRHYCT